MRLQSVVLMIAVLGCQRTEPPPPPPPVKPLPHYDSFKPIGGIEGKNPSYDRSRAPAKIIEAMALQKGQKIADVGAGRGYLTFRLADAVGREGRVVATDVDADAIATLRSRADGRPEISVREVGPDDPGLEPGGYDVILMSEVDHFLHDRVAFLTKLKAALVSKGKLVVTHTRALRPPLQAAAQQAGFTVVSEYDGLPDHYLLIFAAQ